MPQLLDIVYILKEGADPSELIYSLRSVAQNFPHRRVWFVGGQPGGLYPDGRITHTQTGVNKWERVRSSLIKIADCPEITEDFYLFNDDFFVMQPQGKDFVNFTSGTLERRIAELTHNCTGSAYIDGLNRLRAILQFNDLDTMSFAVHLPMLLNKTKLKTLLTCYNTPMFRSLYGNLYRVPFTYHADVKIYDNETEPDTQSDYLSTTEESFKNGKVGEFIRASFPERGIYELTITDRLRQQTAERYKEEADE